MVDVVTEVHDHDDVVAHFDRAADAYHEAHGQAAVLLARRLAVIRALLELGGPARGALLEIGCGDGLHLLELGRDFERLAGLDISSRMIARARARARARELDPELHVGPAESMSELPAASLDAVLCVGAFEHMLDHARVVAEVARVLRPGGCFVCLTHNGDYVWYARIAPALGRDTRHLSTDRSLRRAELRALIDASELELVELRPWSFVARGDMGPAWGTVMHALDWVGRGLRVDALRGGLAFVARKPAQ